MNKNEASQLLKQLAPDGIVYDKDLSDFESKLYPFKIIGRVGGPRGGPNDYTHNCELVLHRQWHYEMFSELLKDVNCVVKDLHGIRSEQGCLDSLPDSYVVIGYGIEGWLGASIFMRDKFENLLVPYLYVPKSINDAYRKRLNEMGAL